MEFGCASTWSQRVLSLTPIAQLSNPVRAGSTQFDGSS